MVVRRAKKSRKMRGHRTMGWGAKGQHRDRGKEGGRQIGMGKEKWSWVVKYGKDWYGKHGFVNPTSYNKVVVTLRQLNDLIDSGKIKIESKDGKNIIDLSKYGYEKLLGSGNIRTSVTIKIAEASEKAKQKIEKIGGQIISPEK
jgi:large subunit ribosomal protein L15